MKTFKELNIKKETKKAIEELNIETLTEIQDLVINEMLKGIDLIAQAQTGTGKTFAFAIPIIENIKENGTIQALVLTPTRELAIQVYGEFIKLLKYLPNIKVTLIVGGESYERQFKSLKRNPEIIIGTPGRIIDHLNRDTINFDSLTSVTFDEADEMLKMGFKEEIETILSNVKDVQTTLFSATIPKEIKEIAKNYQKDAVTLKAFSKTLTVSKIMQNYYVVKKQDKMKLLIRLIDIESAKSVIIFANTKKEVDEITAYLTEQGYNANNLHGDLKQKDRNYVTTNFRKGLINILVATDVAARGLDIKGVELIINYELPHENELYVHRVGRTGRAGLSGKAYTLLTPRTEYKIKEVEKYTNQEIKKMEVPTPKAILKFQTNEFIKEYSLLKDEELNNDKIINEFLKQGLSKEDLLNMLLNQVLPKAKEYEPIDIVKPKEVNKRERRTQTNKQNTKKQTNNKYITLKINLGRKDNVTPVFILDLLRNKYNINRFHIGDIKHYQTFTTFNISLDSSFKIKKNTFNYKGKKLSITIYQNTKKQS